MAKASEHKSSAITKMLLIGESGAGKTGALISLVRAGYKLRIIDMDNGLGYLMRELRKEPALLDLVEYETIRDKLKLGVGVQGVVPKLGVPDAYTKAVKLMGTWSDGSTPSEWGPEYILVLDSFTFFAKAAFLWKETLNPTVKDRRQIYGAAQEACEDVLALLTSEEFNTNLIVISHIRWVTRNDGTTKGYPSAVGEALSPQIPTYFDSLALSESSGTNPVKRTIKTTPTAMIDLKNPAGLDMKPALPIETGLADFFKSVQE
jgi:hypothetical protein